MKNESALQKLERRLNEIPGMSELIANEYSLLIEEDKAVDQVATLVKATRESVGLSQAALGEKVGVTQARISQMERGDVAFGPSILLLARVARACGRSLTLSFGNISNSEQKRAVDF